MSQKLFNIYNVHILKGVQIGVKPEEDRKRYYVSPGGIVVIAKGDVIQV